MSAGDRDTLNDTAELLIEHQINTLNRSHVECLCGWDLEPTPKVEYAGLLAERFYREHLAEVLAARVRAAQTQAWEESCRDHYGDGHYSGLDSCPRNPYRLGDTDG